MHTPDSKDTYDLDPQSEPDTAQERSEPEDVSDNASEGHAEEACSSCGTPRSEDGDPVCPSCGYDRKRHAVVGTTEGIAEAPAEAEMPALIKTRSTHLWLIMAAIATLALIVAWLAGWSSLFVRSEGMYLDASGNYTLDAPRFTERILGIVRWLIAGTTLVGLGSAALRMAAWHSERTVGSWPGAVARVCWVVAIAGLATLIPINITWLEWTTQLVAAGGLAALSSLLVLGLRGVSLGVFMGAWALLVLAVVPMARLVTWSFGV